MIMRLEVPSSHQLHIAEEEQGEEEENDTIARKDFFVAVRLTFYQAYTVHYAREHLFFARYLEAINLAIAFAVLAAFSATGLH